jgi:hypothetical protein
VKQIRKRITYANVMSSIAVFLVLGGGAAYAAKKIGSNEIKGNSITTGKIKKEAVSSSKIKKNSITTAKIANDAVTTAKIANDAVTGEKVKDGSLTGKDINVGTVGTVPNAANANAVNNQSLASFFKEVPNNGAEVTALEFGGVKLTATCPGVVPTLVASKTSSENASARFGSETEATEAFSNGQSSFSTLTLTNAKALGAGTLEVVTAGGKVTTITFAYRDDAFNGSGCRFFGHAITG